MFYRTILALASAVALSAAVLVPARATVIVTGTGCFASSCSLGTLVDNNGTIQVNDKLFSNWTIGSSTTDEPSLRNTEVSGLDDGGLDPGPGLFYDISVVSVTGVGTTTVAWEYDVTVLDPGLRIKDNSLGLNVFIQDGGSFLVTENLTDAAGSPIGSKTCSGTATFSAFTPPCDTALFAPLGFLHVETIVTLTGTDANSFVDIEFVAQRFSQVAEPGTLLIFGLGLAGAGLARRRRIRTPRRAH